MLYMRFLDRRVLSSVNKAAFNSFFALPSLMFDSMFNSTYRQIYLCGVYMCGEGAQQQKEKHQILKHANLNFFFRVLKLDTLKNAFFHLFSGVFVH
jgi:hypothetical protein